MSAAPFAPLADSNPPAPVTPKATCILFYLLRKRLPTGLQRAKLLFVAKSPSNSIPFSRINQLFIRPGLTQCEWTEIIERAWRELGICRTPGITGYLGPHIRAQEYADHLAVGGLFLTMVFKPITVATEYLEPYRKMLETINEGKSPAAVVESIVDPHRTINDATLLHELLTKHIDDLSIEGFIPLNHTELSYQE